MHHRQSYLFFFVIWNQKKMKDFLKVLRKSIWNLVIFFRTFYSFLSYASLQCSENFVRTLIVLLKVISSLNSRKFWEIWEQPFIWMVWNTSDSATNWSQKSPFYLFGVVSVLNQFSWILFKYGIFRNQFNDEENKQNLSKYISYLEDPNTNQIKL